MRPRILIAEDDELQGAMMQTAIRGRGYDVEIVTGGLEAVQRLRTGQYDLALLDYHLPEVDGLAAARLLNDFCTDHDRPRLIAVTATAEVLSEKADGMVGTSFDAIVSKRVGLPALLNVIDANLTSRAEIMAAAAAADTAEASREGRALRKRRMLAPFAAIPSLFMAGAFAVALIWTGSAQQQISMASDSARRTGVVSANTASLVDAVQDAEVSQRTYLATGADVHRELFEADEQRIDRLMESPVAFGFSAAPGFGVDATGPDIVAARLRTLSDEAGMREAGPVAAAGLGIDTGRQASDRLRNWANGLVSGSLRTVSNSLDAAGGNVRSIVGVLTIGLVFGCLAACIAFYRRWPRTRAAVPLMRAMGPLPVRLPRFVPSPVLLQDS